MIFEEEQDPVELERARTAEEKGFAAAGIPARFWDALLKDLPFRRCAFGISKRAKAGGKKVRAGITPQQQRQILRQIIMEPYGQIVVLGGVTTDESPLAAACSVLVQARRRGYGVHVVDAAFAKASLPQDTAVYAVHNILAHASDARVESVRDLLLRWTRPAKIVVVAGCSDPYAFCTNRLCIRPDLVGLVADLK